MRWVKVQHSPSRSLHFLDENTSFCRMLCFVQHSDDRGTRVQYVNCQFSHWLIAAAGLRKDMDECGYQNAVCDMGKLIIVC